MLLTEASAYGTKLETEWLREHDAFGGSVTYIDIFTNKQTSKHNEHDICKALNKESKGDEEVYIKHCLPW